MFDKDPVYKPDDMLVGDFSAAIGCTDHVEIFG